MTPNVLQRETAAALHQERDRSQRYLDTAAVIILALDLEGRITLINRFGCSVLGWTADELQGQEWIEMCIPLRLRGELRRKLAALLAGGMAVNENYVLTRSGEERLIEWRNTVLRSDAGVATGFLASGADITERHTAVVALRVAEERMRFALETANVGIWDMSYETGGNVWSTVLEAQYGLAPGSFGGTFEAFAACIHPDDREAVLATVGKAMLEGADFTMRHRTFWPDGSVHWLNSHGRVYLGAHGEPVRTVGISQDVTEQHSLEEQFRQAQKMEAIGQLAGGVAHDFNNLLTAILVNCELLLVDLEPTDPRFTSISDIQKAGLSAAGLTRQLLAFSRKQIVEPRVLDLNVVVGDVRPLIQRLIGEDVKIVLALASPLVCVKADRSQVEQVVMNLAVNARDAMPQGGTLTITTTAEAPRIVLTVTDTGTGMTPEVQARLFEPFFTTKPVGRGTGLGLATVHGIVAGGGGNVSVRSEVGHGTSVRVAWPECHDAPPEAAEPVPVTKAGGETVLVVEDVDALRRLIHRVLERHGYKVLLAADAIEAVRLFDENPEIDVLLTDVVMPGDSGPLLTSQLQERRPGLKVIYMSGYTEEAVAQQGVLRSGVNFLQKPFTAEMLDRKIREALVP